MTDATYRKKIDLHLVASYGDTFAEASYWNKNPDDKLFFAQIFRMAISAAALESGTTPPPRVYSRDDVAKVFVKIGKHMSVDVPALERLGCTKSILRSFFGQTPAAEPPGGVYIIVPPPSPIDVVTTDDKTNGDDDDGDDVDSLCGDDDALPALPAVDNFDYLSSQPMESGASQSFDVYDLWVDEAPTASQPSEYAVAAAAAAEAAAREIDLQEQERLDTLCMLGKQLEMLSAAMSDVVIGGDARRSMSEHVAALQQLMNKQLQQANACSLQFGDLNFLVEDVGGEENRDGFLDAI